MSFQVKHGWNWLRMAPFVSLGLTVGDTFMRYITKFCGHKSEENE
jgi:hypothetical protein